MCVHVSSDLRPRKQCIEARNRANRVLGFSSVKLVVLKVEVLRLFWSKNIVKFKKYNPQFTRALR